MNRRQFTASLSALMAAPALPAQALRAAPVAATAIPTQARFWAIYMSQLHGTCTPAALSTMTGATPEVARGYLSQLISQNVITPTNIMSRTVSSTQQQSVKDHANRLVDRAKEMLGQVDDDKITETVETPTIDPEMNDPQDT
jgi:hypothetical protein